MCVTTGKGAPAMTVQEWLKMRKKVEEQIKEAKLKANVDRRYEDV